APPTPPPTGSADTPPAHRAPSRRGAGRGRAGPRVGEEERAPSRPSARPRCGAAGAERDRLAHAAWNEYDACAPSGCLRVRGILLGRSPRILRLQTVFRIFGSAHSCRIRVERWQFRRRKTSASEDACASLVTVNLERSCRVLGLLERGRTVNLSRCC